LKGGEGGKKISKREIWEERGLEQADGRFMQGRYEMRFREGNSRSMVVKERELAQALG